MARGGDTECSRIEIWDPENESAEKPIVMLDTVGLVPTILKLSSNHILAASGDREYKESCSPYVKVSLILYSNIFKWTTWSKYSSVHF